LLLLLLVLQLAVLLCRCWCSTHMKAFNAFVVKELHNMACAAG
jgi:hypothetical protein